MAQKLPRGHERSISVEKRDIRVEDYLNDQLQTDADLENLDTLLDNVRNQQGLLKKQVHQELLLPDIPYSAD